MRHFFPASLQHYPQGYQTSKYFVDIANMNSTCTYDIYGCMISYAINYEPEANQPTEQECVFNISGCMDSNASNYIKEANIETACTYDIYG